MLLLTVAAGGVLLLTVTAGGVLLLTVGVVCLTPLSVDGVEMVIDRSKLVLAKSATKLMHAVITQHHRAPFSVNSKRGVNAQTLLIVQTAIIAQKMKWKAAARRELLL